MRSVRLGLLAAIGACCAVVVAPAGMAGAAVARSQSVSAPARASAPAVVLVNAPAKSVCAGHKFKVGVWFQQISGGSRAYRISVSGPAHRRFFYRAGQAPSAGWRFWKVLAGRAGKYRTVYSAHRPGSRKWTTFLATTRARRCRQSSPPSSLSLLGTPGTMGTPTSCARQSTASSAPDPRWTLPGPAPGPAGWRRKMLPGQPGNQP